MPAVIALQQEEGIFSSSIKELETSVGCVEWYWGHSGQSGQSGLLFSHRPAELCQSCNIFSKSSAVIATAAFGNSQLPREGPTRLPTPGETPFQWWESPVQLSWLQLHHKKPTQSQRPQQVRSVPLRKKDESWGRTEGCPGNGTSAGRTKRKHQEDTTIREAHSRPWGQNRQQWTSEEVERRHQVQTTRSVCDWQPFQNRQDTKWKVQTTWDPQGSGLQCVPQSNYRKYNILNNPEKGYVTYQRIKVRIKADFLPKPTWAKSRWQGVMLTCDSWSWVNLTELENAKDTQNVYLGVWEAHPSLQAQACALWFLSTKRRSTVHSCHQDDMHQQSSTAMSHTKHTLKPRARTEPFSLHVTLQVFVTVTKCLLTLRGKYTGSVEFLKEISSIRQKMGKNYLPQICT